MPSSKVASVKVALIKRAVGDESSQEKIIRRILRVLTETEVEIPPLPPSPPLTPKHFISQGILKGGKYHCTIDLLFDWF
jgi:hypothetical protein